MDAVCITTLQAASQKSLGPAAPAIRRLGDESWATEIVQRLIDQICEGVVVCTPDRRWILSNQAFLAEGALAHGPMLEGSYLSMPNTNDLLQLQRAIQQAAEQQKRRLLSFGPSSDKRHALVVPLTSAPIPYILVLFGRHHVCSPLSLEMLGTLYGLTCSEREVLSAIVNGSRPGDIATAKGVQVSTVRTQTSAVRSKLGVPSINDLLRLAARLPGAASALGFRRETRYPTPLPCPPRLLSQEVI